MKISIKSEVVASPLLSSYHQTAADKKIDSKILFHLSVWIYWILLVSYRQMRSVAVITVENRKNVTDNTRNCAKEENMESLNSEIDLGHFLAILYIVTSVLQNLLWQPTAQQQRSKQTKQMRRSFSSSSGICCFCKCFLWFWLIWTSGRCRWTGSDMSQKVPDHNMFMS